MDINSARNGSFGSEATNAQRQTALTMMQDNLRRAADLRELAITIDQRLHGNRGPEQYATAAVKPSAPTAVPNGLIEEMETAETQMTRYISEIRDVLQHVIDTLP